MKAIFTVLSIISLSMSIHAQCSVFNIFSEDGDKFTLYVDGEQINDTPLERVANVKNGKQAVTLRIRFENPLIPDVKKFTQLVDMEGKHNEITFAIIERREKHKVRVRDYKPLSGNVDCNTTYSSGSTTVSTVQEETTVVHNEPTHTETAPVTPTLTPTTNTTPAVTMSTTGSNRSYGVQLAYQWTVGKTYHFQATQVDHMTMSMMGMKHSDVFTTNSSFALMVTNVLSNGTAEGVLYIEDFKVSN